jgi:glycosyltransferase involved in cell wall biosynthesis
MKVFIFSDTRWALGRIHRDVMKQLQCEVRYTDWASYSWHEFNENYRWCDKCITNLVAFKALKPSFSNIDLKKCIFVSHGSVEHEGIQYDDTLHYGMVSDCLKDLFPPTVKPFLMPNGVDPDEFDYLAKSGNIQTLGWCGAPHVCSKQIGWANEISSKTRLPLKIASTLSYSEVKDWYRTIDILLVTAIPVRTSETGPLPAFEAIVSGVPVLGTPVGNFYHVPGQKFRTIEEAVLQINYFKGHPDELVALAKEQYDWVMKNWTYQTLANHWKHALEFS